MTTETSEQGNRNKITLETTTKDGESTGNMTALSSFKIFDIHPSTYPIKGCRAVVTVQEGHCSF